MHVQDEWKGSADPRLGAVRCAAHGPGCEVSDRRVRPFGGGSFTFSLFQARALDCQAMVLALAAQPAAVSHLRTLAFDETLPDELPWQVAMIVSGAEAERIATGRPQATWREALFEPLTEYSSCGNYCGSYRAMRMLLLTRRTPEAPVELIRELEY